MPASTTISTGVRSIRLLTALFFFAFFLTSCGPSQNELSIGALKHFRRGNQLFMNNNPRDAAAEYQMAIAMDDQQSVFYFNLGLAYYRLVLYDHAIDAYQAAITLNPKFGEAWYNLSLALDKTGDSDKAFIAYENYQKLNQSVAKPVPSEDREKPIVLKRPKKAKRAIKK